MNKDLVTGLVGAAIILVFAAIFTIKYFTTPKKEDKDNAKKFLDGLRDTLYKSMIDIVINFDYSNYEDLPSLEIEIINKLVETSKDYIKAKIVEASNNNLLSVLALKFLSSNTENIIDTFVINIIDSINIEENIQQATADKFVISCEENEKSEKELETKYSTGEFDNEDLNIDPINSEDIPYKEKELTEEEMSTLNPPREDGEEDYDPNDISMELIDEDEEDIYIDKNGRARSRSTGKFIKSKK